MGWWTPAALASGASISSTQPMRASASSLSLRTPPMTCAGAWRYSQRAMPQSGASIQRDSYAAGQVERLPDPRRKLAELPGRALAGVRAQALDERQQRLDAPAQALRGGAAEQGALHRVHQLPQGLAGQLVEQQPVDGRRRS